MIITTSICANYLPKAIVLANSVKKTNPNAYVLVCLLEQEVHNTAKECEAFDEIVLAKDLGFEQFDKFIFKHSIVEAATSVKGQLFRYMLNNFPHENKFVYLDPDIEVYSELIELDAALNEHAVVLTPHLCHPEHILDAVMDNELCALQHGVFNLGFLAISRSEEGQRFADWWASRLAMFCYDDIPRGIFTDQKWVDLAPCYFDVYILKHPGYNVAPWNLSKRKLTYSEENGYLVNEQPLIFFHYSGFDSGANEAMIRKYVPDLKNCIYELRDRYVEQLAQHNQLKLGKEKWSYDFFYSGQQIERSSRIAYRDIPELVYKIENPFGENNELFKKYANVQQVKGQVSRQVKGFLRKLIRR